MSVVGVFLLFSILKMPHSFEHMPFIFLHKILLPFLVVFEYFKPKKKQHMYRPTLKEYDFMRKINWFAWAIILKTVEYCTICSPQIYSAMIHYTTDDIIFGHQEKKAFNLSVVRGKILCSGFECQILFDVVSAKIRINVMHRLDTLKL